MSNIEAIEHRLEHAQKSIETAENHCENEGDSQALSQAFGLLEAAIFDLQDLRDDLQRSDDET